MKVCPMCFEPNEATAEFCKECGAPLKSDSEGSDQEVYTDLARANLLRTRGDMKGANDVCLSILKRYPNNPTAHSLLGDIAADQDDLKQAQTWYEMALDLVPGNANDQKKLEAVKTRIRAREAAEAANIIGIPETKSKFVPYLVLLLFTAGAFGTGAYFLGKFGSGAKQREQTTINTPVSLNPDREQPESSVPPVTSQDPPQVQEDKPITATGAVPTDEALLQALQTKGTSKLEYVSVNEDPRGPSATVTVRLTSEAPYLTATRAGLEFFKVLPAFAKVSIRILDSSEIVFVADMTREAAKTAEAALAGGDTIDSQAQVMLSQTWSPPHKSETGQAPPGQ